MDMNYRLHFLVEGRVQSAQAFAATSDRDAKARVEDQRRGRAAELWNFARLVRKYPAGG
jgi:hypothetical protein